MSDTPDWVKVGAKVVEIDFDARVGPEKTITKVTRTIVLDDGARYSTATRFGRAVNKVLARLWSADDPNVAWIRNAQRRLRCLHHLADVVDQVHDYYTAYDLDQIQTALDACRAALTEGRHLDQQRRRRLMTWEPPAESIASKALRQAFPDGPEDPAGAYRFDGLADRPVQHYCDEHALSVCQGVDGCGKYDPTPLASERDYLCVECAGRVV